MNRSTRCTRVLAGLMAALSVTLSWQAQAGTRGGKVTPERIPAFSTGLIVKIKTDALLDSTLIAKARAAAARQGISLSHVRKLARGGDLLALDKALPDVALRRLAAEIQKLDERIDYVEPDVVMVPMGLSNDKHVAAQWNLTDPVGGIYVNEAWPMSKGQGVVVAVVDSGIRPHVDLMANVLPGYDFVSNRGAARDGNGRDAFAWDEGNWTTAGQCGADQIDPDDSTWHGTHVAGTIAAVSNNSIGVAGVAPKAKVLPVRALGRCGGYTSDIIDGMLWAAGLPVDGVPANPHPARVINLSLGSVNACSRSFQAAIDAVRAQGAVVVAAAGNSDIDVARISPAGCQGVIAVAASTREGKKAYYSNYGKRISVAAPGGDMLGVAENGILSTYNSGTKRPGVDVLAYMQGTSMAAPHVAGVAALMLAINPSLNPDKVQMLLKQSARPMSAAVCRGGCGGGLVDAAAAVAAAAVAN
ncbi:S8 family peptidase [Ideonella sp.]|uniref:S8 family peptidase n=1 Tax=Ideonella sp. TaxID=1929293 RepID=UPI002B4A7FE9|nr:S8 family peptidase [Ideonella sp.]HJV68139.1 S8 family peptidase [Ideonella sp.]